MKKIIPKGRYGGSGRPLIPKEWKDYLEPSIMKKLKISHSRNRNARIDEERNLRKLKQEGEIDNG